MTAGSTVKTVLIMGHFWPYSPRGSKRILGLAKYLPEFGWSPIVISGELSSPADAGFRIVETPAPHRIETLKRRVGLKPGRGLQTQLGVPVSVASRDNSLSSRLVKAVEAVVTYPDVEIGWRRHAIPAAERVIESQRIDSLLSVWPIPAHLAAGRLSKRHHLPWLADFPDLWAHTYSYRYGRIRKWFDRRLERRVLRGAHRLTTSSGPLTEIMRRMHGREDVETVLMGYDPERVNDPPAQVTREFTVTYTGIFYGADRNPHRFLEGLSQFLDQQNVDRGEVDVRFFGPVAPAVQERAARAGLSDVVHLLGKVSWDECLERQRESQVLLQLNWENPSEKGAYSGKIAEYLAARRPVLSVGGSAGDVMESVMSETRCGAYCLTAGEVATALGDFYAAFKRCGVVPYGGDLEAIEQYSYRRMAGKFASLLDDLLDS